MAKWGLRKTLLLVGEGLHDEAFLTHVKRNKAPRGCGLEVMVKNAKGKGALHVVNFTIRQTKNAQFDHVAAMVDSDTNFDDSVVALAKKHRITLIVSVPCFEALLLRTVGEKPKPSQHLKKQFAPYVHHDPTEPRNYEQHFSIGALENAMEDEEALRALFRLFL
jgi:hypothetical protein